MHPPDAPNGNPLPRRDDSGFNQTRRPSFEVATLSPLELSRAVINPAAFGTTPKNPPPKSVTIRADECIPKYGVSSSTRIRPAALNPQNDEHITNLPPEEHNFLPLEYRPLTIQANFPGHSKALRSKPSHIAGGVQGTLLGAPFGAIERAP
jgi:hypothetical protein